MYVLMVEEYERQLHLAAVAGSEAAEFDVVAGLEEWLEQVPVEGDPEQQQIRRALGLRS